MCFGCSKEPSHRDVSFEYRQQNKKTNFQLRALIWGPGPEVIKLESILKLKIQRIDWLLGDMCLQAANHCALF